MCYVTAAAVAWLLTGRDVAPPFSGCWLSAAEGTGPADADRVIAYGTVDDEGNFEPEHIVVAAPTRGMVLIDSHWGEGRALTVCRAAAAPSAAGEEARHILLGC